MIKKILLILIFTNMVNADTIRTSNRHKNNISVQSTKIYFPATNRLRPVNKSRNRYNNLLEKYNKLLKKSNKEITHLREVNRLLKREIAFLQKKETKEEKSERAEAIEKMRIEIKRK